MSGTRSRNLSRLFVFLRQEEAADQMPNATKMHDLEESGRTKEIEFNNQATTNDVMELFAHQFSLNGDDVPRWDA